MKKYAPNPQNLPSKLETHHDFAVFRDVRIPMRDGVELSANIYFPAVNGEVDLTKKYPVILTRGPYMGTNGELTAYPPHFSYYAAELGFVLIVCAVRGTFKSDGGDLWPVQNEGWGEHRDGVDTLKWVRAQPWCDGRVGACGTSYLGATQYTLLLTDENPGLDASALHVPAVNSYDGGWCYSGEFFDMESVPSWANMMSFDQMTFHHLPDETIREMEADYAQVGVPMEQFMAVMALNYPQLQAKHGVINIPIARHMPFYRAYLEHREDPDYFSYNDVKSHKHDINMPLLFVAGWFDLFLRNTVQGYELAVKDAPTEEIARGHRLIIGPWTHGMPTPWLYPNGMMDLRVIFMEWIRRQMDGISSPFYDEVPVALYVMGEYRWRAEPCWPLADTETQTFYLHSGGKANSALGDGCLNRQAPDGAEAADRYLYDPSDPIINAGGIGMAGGQADQADVEARDDVLVYTTPAMEADLEVTGVIRASFYAATSATDTDFFVRIVDVDEDGKTVNVVSGGRRGRYIKNGRTNPTALVPGEILKYEFTLSPVCYVFKKGHKLRVDLCSNDAKYFEANPNAFIDLNTATEKDYVTAEQTVYHDAEHPAVLELPVVPESHERNWIEWPFDAEKFDGVDFYQSAVVPYSSNDPVFKDRDELH